MSSHLALSILSVRGGFDGFAGWLIWPAYILFPRGVGAFEAGYAAIPLASCLVGVIGAISCVLSGVIPRFGFILIASGIVAFIGNMRFQASAQQQMADSQKSIREEELVLANPSLDFRGLFDAGGYKVRGIGTARPRALLEYSYFVGAHASDPNVQKAVPVLLEAIREDERSNRNWSGQRAAAASAIYRITGKKVYYLGVEHDIHECGRGNRPDPYDSKLPVGKCSALSEIQKD